MELSSSLQRSPTLACQSSVNVACLKTDKVRIKVLHHPCVCLTFFFLSDIGIKSAQGEQEVFSSPSPKKSPSPTQRFTHRANITTSPKQAAKKTMIPPIKVTRLYGDSLVDGAYGKSLKFCCASSLYCVI